MAFETIQFPLTGGLSRAIIPLKANKASLFTMANFRQSNSGLGRVEQTPWFCNANGGPFPQGTYYDGGSQTEPTTSAIRFMSFGLLMTDYVFWSSYSGGATAVKAFYQTTVPTGETVNTGCRIVINSLSGLNITLGNSFDIRINTDDHHFNWRKNGGAWSADIVISTAGNAIDTGSGHTDVTVYWLASTGFDFATPSTWSWTRYDRAYSNATYIDTLTAAQGIYYRNSCYFTSTDRRIMQSTVDDTNHQYVISLGYRPVYGSFVTVFSDHLVIGKFDNTATYSTSNNRNLRVGWSDKGDFHNFIPTDTNEADSKLLTYAIRDDQVSSSGGQYSIVGVAVFKQQVYVFTSTGIYSSSDLGLPLVFSFQQYEFDEIIYGTGSSVCVTPSKIYLLGRSEIYVYDGASFETIAQEVYPYIVDLGLSAFSGMLPYYDLYRNELVLVSTVFNFLLCYQEKFKTWYTRSASFGAAYYIASVYVYNNVVVLGLGNLTVLQDDPTGATAAPVKDSTAGTVFATPTITTQLIGDTLKTVKESGSSYIGAAITTIADTTRYSTSANVRLQLYWYKSTTGLITGSPSTNSSATWTSASADGIISAPRENFRSLALEVQVAGLVSGKPPAYITLTDLTCEVSGLEKKVER